MDTADAKFQDSPGLQKWAAIENLKIASQTYNEVDSLSELEQKTALKSESGKSAKQSVVKLERQLKNLAEIIKYTEQYKANRPYHTAYKKSKNPDAYFRMHESQIILYGGARRMLEQAGIKLKWLDVEKLKSRYQGMLEEKKKLTAAYKGYEKESAQLKKKLDNLNQFLGKEVQNTPAIKTQQPSL